MIADTYERMPARFGPLAHVHNVAWPTLQGLVSGRQTKHSHAGGDVEHHDHRNVGRPDQKLRPFKTNDAGEEVK